MLELIAVASVLAAPVPRPLPASMPVPAPEGGPFGDEWGSPPARFWELLAGAPPWGDRFRWPDAASARRGIDANRAYRSRVATVMAGESAFGVLPPWREAYFTLLLDECDYLFRVYDAVEDAGLERSAWYNRAGLARLRDLLGPDAYARGNLPPCVPLWRFQEYAR